MPVFHQHKAIFIHLPKNAGRSIEEAFLGDAGTPDSGRRNLINRAGTFVQRHSASPFATEFLLGTKDYTFAAQHLTFLEMEHLRLVPADVLSSYRLFCVCRNPFDRMVSTVLHFAKADGKPAPSTSDEFEGALLDWTNLPKSDHNLIAHDRSQSDYVVNARGEQAVETVLRFESLTQDYGKLAQELGITNGSLTWFGKASRNRRYQDYYNSTARNLVARKFAEDLDRFEYQFDD